MIFSIKKFNKEIVDLKRLAQKPARSLDPTHQVAIKTRVLNAILSPRAQSTPVTSGWHTTLVWLRYAFATLVSLALLSSGVTFASTYAKPGDLLFPIKKATEQGQIQFAATEDEKIDLQTQFAEKRLEELLEIQKENEGLPSPTENIRPQEEVRPQVKPKTRAEKLAETEVSAALENLKNLQTELRKKGDTKNAENVNRGIRKLENGLNRKNDRQSDDVIKDNESREDSEREDTETTERFPDDSD